MGIDREQHGQSGGGLKMFYPFSQELVVFRGTDDRTPQVSDG